jgi:DNA-binding transcriptional LysR family regulator
MELRQLRYFIAAGEEQHIHRAAKRLRIAQPALSRQIQNLEEEIGFELFERLPRGVRLSPAGKLYLNDARRIMAEIGGAVGRTRRIAHGQAGVLRVGCVDSLSWNGIVPDSFKVFREQQPDAELDLRALITAEQVAAIEAGSLDAGFIVTSTRLSKDLAQLEVSAADFEVAVPADHPLTQMEKVRLRDLVDYPFVWFPRYRLPAFYDELMAACAKGGLNNPRIVQETEREVTLLTLVSWQIGLALVTSNTRWRCPPGVVLLPVADLHMAIRFSLVYRRGNRSVLLAKFVAGVRSLLG